MASLEELKNERLKKIKVLEKAGFSAFPAKTDVDTCLAKAVSDFEKIKESGKTITTAGRIIGLRQQGGLIFLDLVDGGLKLQVLLKEDELGESFKLLAETIDLGDFIQVTGVLFTTKRGEKTLSVSAWKILAKALRPLPDQWAGLQDVEERFRRRYLDSLLSAEVRNRFILRSKIIAEIRQFLQKAGYLEVDTPVLQPLVGGATALPFVTHHNALDIDLYLRIAPELYLKKMLIGDFPRVFEIARNFRNEGIDATHNPEFTMLEFYEAYSDASKQMKLTEKMLKKVVKSVFGETKINYDGQEINFGQKFKKISYVNLLKEEVGADISKLSRAEADEIYKKKCRPKIVQPTFLTDYPVSHLPLAKKKNSKTVDAWQLLAGGLELAKAFSELNDPVDQLERFQNEEKNRLAGDQEAQPSDLDYVEALEYGLPPAGGVGIGLDRLAMLLTGATNIREVVFFPTLRPK